jgi:aerobic carbon-monoxide dehydrogenase medium subunit
MMRSFDYYRPKTLAEVSTALASSPDARAFAGGMTLIPALKLRLSAPSALVDLGGIAELRGIKIASGNITVGAMTRHVEVERSAEIREAIPALANLAGGIGDPQVRNRGTIGGSIANNDPAADYPAALLGLGATVTTTKRSMLADSFFTGMFETALGAGEIITGVSFPVPLAAAYEKFRSPASRYALVGVFVAKTKAGVRVAVTGAAPSVFRAKSIEAALSEKFAPESVASIRIPADGLNSDIHGDADYRAHLVGVLAKRAVEKALAPGGKR